MAVLVVKRAADYVEAGLSLGAFEQNLFFQPRQNYELAITNKGLAQAVTKLSPCVAFSTCYHLFIFFTNTGKIKKEQATGFMPKSQPDVIQNMT